MRATSSVRRPHRREDYVFSRGGHRIVERSSPGDYALYNAVAAAGEPRAGLENGGFFWGFFQIQPLLSIFGKCRKLTPRVHF